MKEFVALMACIMSVVAISIDAMLPALGTISHDFALTNPNHAQFMITSIFIGMATGQLIAGPLSDALGRKKLLMSGFAIYFTGSLICYFAPSFEVILIGRVIQGLAVSAPYVSAYSIVRDKYSGRDMAKVMSVVMAIFILVPALAPSIGQLIINLSSWHEIFIFYLVYSSIVLTWIAIRLDETLPPEKRIRLTRSNYIHGLKEILGNRTTVCYTIATGICFGALIGYLNSSQQIFQVQFKVGEMFSIYFGMLALVLGAASLINSRFVQKLGMRYICKRAMFTIAVASLLFLIVNLTVEVKLWMFLAYALVLFFSIGFMFGNLNAIAMEPMGHIAGMAAAIIGCTSSVISLLLGTLIGQLYDNTLIPIASGFLILSILALTAMICAEGKKFASE